MTPMGVGYHPRRPTAAPYLGCAVLSLNFFSTAKGGLRWRSAPSVTVRC